MEITCHGSNDFSIFRYLLRNNANVAAVNNDGDLPYDICEEDEMEKLLQEAMDEQGILHSKLNTSEQRRIYVKHYIDVDKAFFLTLCVFWVDCNKPFMTDWISHPFGYNKVVDSSFCFTSLEYAGLRWNILGSPCVIHSFTWERSGSVLECLTRDRRAAGLSLNGVTALCP